MSGGRPTKLSLEIQERIVSAITAGNYIETAAAFAGISKVTLYKWLRRGARAHAGAHHEFVNAIEKALASAEVRDVATIARAASGYDVERTKETAGVGGITVRETTKYREFAWQAAAWRLERKHPERWGRRVEVTGKSEVVHTGAKVLVIGGDEAAYVEALKAIKNGHIEQAALPSGAGEENE